MFKVECPGCKAPYQVDERRVPASGLKMRCPKCGTTFKVEPPAPDNRRTGPSPVLGASLGFDPAPGTSPPPVPQRSRRATQVGVGIGGSGLGGKPPAPAPHDPDLDDLGLPAVGQQRDARAAADSDLPSPVAPQRTDLPAPRAPQGRPQMDSFGEIDLPSVGSMRTPPPQAAPPADLPSPARPKLSDLPDVARSRGLDLPSPVEFDASDLPSVGGDFGVDLPAVGPSLPATAADLPAVGRGRPGAVELPSPASDLPSVGRDYDFPALSADLPSLGGGLPSPAAELPSRAAGLPQAAAGLPAVAAGLPAVGAGLPAVGGNLPSPAFGEIDLGGGAPPPRLRNDSLPDIGVTPPPPGSMPPRGSFASDPFGDDDPFGRPAPQSDPFGTPAAGLQDSFGRPGSVPPRSVPPGAGGASEGFGEFGGSGPPPSRDSADVVRQAGGGVSYGEVNLEGGDDDGMSFEGGGGDDDMEFGAIPQEDQVKDRPGPAQPLATHVQLRVGETAELAPPKKRRGRVALGVVVAALLGGGALALVPSVGPFGAYWIMDRVQSGAHTELLQKTILDSRAEMAKDTFASANAAFAQVDQARAKAERVKPLAAYTAFVGFLSSLRFGSDSKVSARAKVILQELAEESDVEQLELARGAEAASDGNLARARQVFTRLIQADPKNIDALVALGEVELLAKEPASAMAAWTSAAAVEASPRTDFGLARAKLLSGDTSGAEALAKKVTEVSKDHAGARILLARAAWTTHDEDDAIKLLAFVEREDSGASPSEVVDAETLLGDVHLSRSRFTHAEKAYQRALTISPKAAGALAGLGDALYRSGRYSEALARFKAALEADPDGVSAAIGMAKTKIALERLEDAKGMLKKLSAAHPTDARVGFWLGRAEEALGNRKEAEAAYKRAIETGQDESAVVEAYIGMAMLMSQQGRNDEAEAQLAAAQKKMPDSPAIFKALGEVALAQGRYDASVAQFKKALSLDKRDIGAQFRLGVALRRGRDFEAARKQFDAVAEVDREYPGLALERGLLFEAAGRSEEALKEYEAALAKAPNDPDLKLRVGCGKVSAGRGAQAEKILREVLQQRPTSAETNHCLGRALLLKGNSLAEALKSLERARDLDPNRAEYHLYVGWAANEAGNHRKAEESLAKALELDQGMADAYWQRGVLRYRQGAVRDAITDLKKALELRPTRYEAHAALADSYYDLGREREAMEEWRKAIEADPSEPTWRFRYGKLLAANRQENEAREQLEKAIEEGEKADPKPRWMWEAHRLYAKALGGRKEAARHWEAYLRDGPRDSPYRSEAKEALKKLGRPWDGP